MELGKDLDMVAVMVVAVVVCVILVVLTWYPNMLPSEPRVLYRSLLLQPQCSLCIVH